MPDMNGFELQRLLKLRVPQAGILMMTALPEEGLKQKALSAGAHCFLQKPFDVDSLKECLFGLPDLDTRARHHIFRTRSAFHDFGCCGNLRRWAG